MQNPKPKTQAESKTQDTRKIQVVVDKANNKAQNQQPLTFHSAFSKQIQQQNSVKTSATTNKTLLTSGKAVKLVKQGLNNLPQQNVLKTNLVVPDSKRNAYNHSNNNSQQSSIPENTTCKNGVSMNAPVNVRGNLGGQNVHQVSVFHTGSPVFRGIVRLFI